MKNDIINGINKFASEKMKELRIRKNITQQELADDLGIKQKQISRYELNQRVFKQDFLFKLADYFGVSVDYFFPDEYTIIENRLKEDILNDIIKEARKLPIEKQTMLLGIIKAMQE